MVGIHLMHVDTFSDPSFRVKALSCELPQTRLALFQSMYCSLIYIPHQLSFNDPRAYFDIYSTGSKFAKAASFYKMFGQYESSFGFIDSQNSKIRREILNPLFSRRAIISLEDVIQQKVRGQAIRNTRCIPQCSARWTSSSHSLYLIVARPNQSIWPSLFVLPHWI